MNYCALTICLACLVVGGVHGFKEVPEDMKETVTYLHNTCVAETGVNEDLIVDANNGNLKDDPKFKCYLKCVMMLLNVMKPDGTVDTQAMIDALVESDKKSISPTVISCGTKKGVDHCDTAFQTHKCYQSTDPVNYYII